MGDPRAAELDRRAAPFLLDRLGVRLTRRFGSSWDEQGRFILRLARNRREARRYPPEVYAISDGQIRLWGRSLWLLACAPLSAIPLILLNELSPGQGDRFQWLPTAFACAGGCLWLWVRFVLIRKERISG